MKPLLLKKRIVFGSFTDIKYYIYTSILVVRSYCIYYNLLD